MAHEVVAFPGGYLHVLVDSKFKADVADLCQQRFGQEKSKLQDARIQLLRHPYFVTDDWYAAERRYEKQRYSRCRKLLLRLARHLEGGTVAQKGIEGITGQAALTAKRLTDRHVPLLDMGRMWLLIELERHPQEGGDKVQVQYWLYSEEDRQVHLLKHRFPEATPLFLVQRAGGRAGPPTTERRDSFYELVGRLLGLDWVDRFKSLLKPDKTLLARSPGDVVEECSRITGINLREQEEARRHDRERSYTRRYGPRPQSSVFSIDHQVGLRVGFEITPKCP